MAAHSFITRSFRSRLLTTTLIVLLAMLGLLVWQTWVLLDQELRNRLRDNVGQTGDLLATAITLPMAQRDFAMLADIANNAVERQAVAYLVIEDHRGRRIAAAGNIPDPLPADPVRDRESPRGDHYHARHSVYLAGEQLGEFHYGVPLAFVDEARRTVAGGLLRIGAVGVLYGTLLMAWLGVWLMRRLNVLETSAQRLAAGQLGERIDIPGADEISRLAGAFNHMADKLTGTIGDLRDRETRFRHAVEGSSDGIWDWDLERGKYYFSPRHKTMLGYRDDELANDRNLLESLVLEKDREQLDAAMRRHFEEHQPFDCEFRMRHKDGHIIWCRSRGQAIWNAQGRVVRFSGATSDVTAQKQAEATFEHMAHYDALTKLPNRALLADRMAMALAQARRRKGHLAVALLDLDGFKPVNDTYGHDVGDLVLIEVARRLRAALREVDTVARLGGDEFVLVLPDFGAKHDYQNSLDRVLETLGQPYPIGDGTAMLSASIGVTVFPDDDADADTLVRHADQAMYTAKQAGRNRYHFFDAVLDREVQLRLGERNRIIAALGANEFCLHYQPTVNLRTGRVTGAAALIRWQHPERGVVQPAEFLPLIEDNDFTVQLSEWVIDRALTQMEEWQANGLTLRMSVNLPARHLQEAGFHEYLQGVLAAHPTVAPALFELEVLESTTLEDVADIAARMQQCRDLGVRFSLDNFGTGYASLSCLRRLPIELIRIDQSIVRDMLVDTDDLATVEGVIWLGDAFRRDVIAEGAQTLDHAVMLLHLGCDLVQGYGIARPMPAQALPAWVAAWRPDPALTIAARHPLSRQDMTLALAEVQHRRWISFLGCCVAEGTPFPPAEVPLDDASCRFGQWLRGVGRRNYGALAEYRVIDDAHRRVHALGRQIADLCHDRKHDQALELQRQLLTASDDLINRLHALIAAVSSAVQRE